MSRNQKHAIELADGICRGEVEPSRISDTDWSLLLLAAGLNNACAGPLAVARGVILRFREKAGYFAGYADEIALSLAADAEPGTAA